MPILMNLCCAPRKLQSVENFRINRKAANPIRMASEVKDPSQLPVDALRLEPSPGTIFFFSQNLFSSISRPDSHHSRFLTPFCFRNQSKILRPFTPLMPLPKLRVMTLTKPLSLGRICTCLPLLRDSRSLGLNHSFFPLLILHSKPELLQGVAAVKFVRPSKIQASALPAITDQKCVLL